MDVGMVTSFTADIFASAFHPFFALVATSTAILAAAAIGGAASLGTAAISASASKRQRSSLLDSVSSGPTPPNPDQVSADARTAILKRAASKTKTILTSPTGLNTEAATQKKTLLGE